MTDAKELTPPGDLILRLQQVDHVRGCPSLVAPCDCDCRVGLCHEAASALLAQAKRVAELEGAINASQKSMLSAYKKGASAIASIEQRVIELETVLGVFAAMSDAYCGMQDDHLVYISVGNLRRARAALAKEEG